MAALGRFIARSREKALPFFKIMKCTGKFEWTPEADKAFVELKRYLTSPPIMVIPRARQPLLLYIAATPWTMSVVLVAEWEGQIVTKEKVEPPRSGASPGEEPSSPDPPREEVSSMPSTLEPPLLSGPPEPPKEAALASVAKVQQHVYFVSTVLRDAHEHYTMQQKLLYTLLIA
jgi:hypothetical protein